MDLHRWLSGLLLTACSYACAGDELTLGRAAPVIDLHRCQATDCAPDSPTPRELAFSDDAVCIPSETGQLEAAFFVRLWPMADECNPDNATTTKLVACEQARRMPVDCPGFGPCRLTDSSTSTALSPDGSIWTTATFGGAGPLSGPGLVDASAGGVWLQRYAQDGTLLNSKILATESVGDGEGVIFGAQLNVNRRGHAFVLIHRESGARGRGDIDRSAPSTVSRWVLELDEQGRRVGDPIELADEAVTPVRPGTLAMLSAGARLFFVAQAFGGGGLAMFDLATRETRWVQTRAGRLGIASVAVDAADELTVATRSPNGLLSRTLEHYRSDGTLAWAHKWPAQGPDQGGDYLDGALAADSQGDLSLLLGDSSGASRLLRVNRDGEPLFARGYIDADPDLSNSASWRWLESIAAMRSGARVYSPSTLFDEITSTHLVMVVSFDGKRCKRYAWRRPGYYNFIGWIVQDDALYFWDARGFGRLELPPDFEP